MKKCIHHNCKNKSSIVIDNLFFCRDCAIYHLLHTLKRKKHFRCIGTKFGCYCKCNIKKQKQTTTGGTK